MSLSDRGRLDLDRLRRHLLSAGGPVLAEAAADAAMRDGDPVPVLAIIGYLLQEVYADVLLVWMKGYAWFAPLDGTDRDLISQMWRLLRAEEGSSPGITVDQFFAHRFPDSKVKILGAVLSALQKARKRIRADEAKSSRRRVCRLGADLSARRSCRAAAAC